MKQLLLFLLLVPISLLSDDFKQTTSIEDKKKIIIADEIFKKYHKFSNEIQLAKKHKVPLNRLYKDNYLYDFNKFIKKDDIQIENGKDVEPQTIFCQDDYILDLPIKECFYYINYNFKDIYLSRLKKVIIKFSTPIAKTNNILYKIINKEYIPLKTIYSFTDGMATKIDYYFDEKYKDQSVDDINKAKKETIEYFFKQKDIEFLVAESFVELKDPFAKPKIKDYLDINEYLNLSQDYTRYINKIMVCKNDDCDVEVEFIANESLHYLINEFYKINDNDELLKIVYQNPDLKMDLNGKIIDEKKEEEKEEEEKINYDF